jgi:hypothetical protein
VLDLIVNSLPNFILLKSFELSCSRPWLTNSRNGLIRNKNIWEALISKILKPTSKSLEVLSFRNSGLTSQQTV